MNSSSDFGYGKLLAKLQKQEESGELYRELVEPSREVYFSGPLKQPFAKEEFARRQPELRAWAEFWRRGLPTGSRSQAPLWEIEEKTIRYMGRQSIPGRVVLRKAGMALRILGLEDKADWFRKAYGRVLEELPQLREWFFARQRLIYAQQFYPGLLAIGRYLLAHPGERYLREYDIPGIDTKFLEHHGRLFRELYNALYPEIPAENAAELHKQLAIRPLPAANICVRILDGAVSCCGLREFFLSPQMLAGLQLPLRRVFIVENKMNVYTFPAVKDSLLLGGAGYDILEAAREASWLQDCQEIWYWGDLDSHGFDILSQLRDRIPRLRSLLMDRAAIQAASAMAVTDTGDCAAIPKNLSVEEKSAWQLLRQRKWRIEQERLDKGLVVRALAAAALE